MMTDVMQAVSYLSQRIVNRGSRMIPANGFSRFTHEPWDIFQVEVHTRGILPRIQTVKTGQ